MASVGLPPPPINDAPGSFTWLEWYRQLRSYVSTSGSVPWYIINFAGSNITDIATRLHNNLQGLQGGTAGEMYHLTAAEVLTARYTIQYSVPTTGFNITVANTTRFLILEPAGGLASGTITMPASPVTGQVVSLLSTKAVTSLTHSPNTGQTLLSPITSMTAQGRYAWIYYAPTTTWYHVA